MAPGVVAREMRRAERRSVAVVEASRAMFWHLRRPPVRVPLEGVAAVVAAAAVSNIDTAATAATAAATGATAEGVDDLSAQCCHRPCPRRGAATGHAAACAAIAVDAAEDVPTGLSNP
eukprot:jgi/Ulvmu1/11428/UM076_0002.1